MKYENWQAFELVKLYFRIPHPLTSRLIQVGKCAFFVLLDRSFEDPRQLQAADRRRRGPRRLQAAGRPLERKRTPVRCLPGNIQFPG